MDNISSMENEIQLIPLQSVMSDIYRLIGNNGVMSEDDLLESCAKAASHLYNYKIYEHTVCLLAVNNHKTVLPPYHKVEAVLFRSDIDQINTKELILTTQSGISSDDTTHTIVFSPSLANPYRDWQFLTLGHDIGNLIRMKYLDIIDNNLAEDYSNSNDLIINKSRSIGTTCVHTYSVKDRVLSVSPECGYVMVFYKYYPTDDQGNYLIPNIALVIEAIKSYVFADYHLLRMNMNKEGAMNMHDYFFNRWERQSVAAQAKMMMPSISEQISISQLNRYFKESGGTDAHSHIKESYNNIGIY